MLDPRPAGDGSFSYQKIFADNEFIAAGQLVVPPGSSKPGKSTKDNTYVCIYWLHGARC
jgi:centromere protein C